MTQPYPGKDPNFTQAWWALICSAPGKIERARAKTRAVREGRVPPSRYDFGDALTKAGLDGAAEYKAKRDQAEGRTPLGEPGSWRDEA
jgi:hypothetical protein